MLKDVLTQLLELPVFSVHAVFSHPVSPVWIHSSFPAHLANSYLPYNYTTKPFVLNTFCPNSTLGGGREPTSQEGHLLPSLAMITGLVALPSFRSLTPSR